MSENASCMNGRPFGDLLECFSPPHHRKYNNENEPRMRAHQSHQISRRPSLRCIYWFSLEKISLYCSQVAFITWNKNHQCDFSPYALKLCEWDSTTDASIACMNLKSKCTHFFFFEAVKANWIWEKESRNE